MDPFIAQREHHIRSARPGLDAARDLSSMTDEAVRELSRAASSRHPGRWAIAALGGWGAGALLPASDLDILVLSDLPADKLKPFVEAVLYPLWDAGLKVGHQVRSPKQQLKAMRDDLKTRTAALTARPIAGDREWAAAALSSCVSSVAKKRRPALATLRQRSRPGSPYLLEPDLKNGAGGRRDFDELTWSAALVAGAVQRDPGALVVAGVLDDAEFRRLTEGAESIAEARWCLQRDGFGDLMSLDSLESLGPLDAEKVQAALGETALVLASVRARLDGSVGIPDSPCTAAEVFGLFSAGDPALESLELYAQAGRLDSLVPGFSALMSTRRPGLGHELTVGAHCLKTASACTSPSGDGALTRSLEEVDDVRTLRVACLVHDVAKCEGGAGHAERGAAPGRAAARAFGLDDQAAEDVADLVRLHLVLIETALRDDLDDEDALLRCAARIGKRRLLAQLHLLTAADSIATGSSTWTPWTAALVGSLVSRLDAALSEEVDGAGLAKRGETVRQAALSALGDTNGDRAAFVQRAPLRYLASRDLSEVVRDAGLVAGLGSSAAAHGALIAVSAGPVQDTHAVTIVAPDRPELLARLAGAIALAGLDILAVDAYSAADGVALDAFVVTSATRRTASTETFASLERFVRAALRDRLELATRLGERRNHYPAASEVPVTVETTPSGWDTTVRVTAPDRPGLLHDIAHAVSVTGVDIRWAKAQTIDGVATDTFHVVGGDGGPVDDPGILGHLAMRIRESV